MRNPYEAEPAEELRVCATCARYFDFDRMCNVPEAVEKLLRERFGIVLVVRAADHDGIRLAFFDHFQKERPLLGHAVEVVGREQHDPSVGNRVDIGDAGLE